MIRSKDIRNFACRYHRNGVAGIGFFACSFLWRDGRSWRPMVASVVPDEPGACHVMQPDNISLCWRGDDFEPVLRAAIAACGDDAFTGASHAHA